jgi:small-conductance mechanosensitive channel
VGDAIVLTSNREDTLSVRRIHLANTVFQRWNGEILLIANNVLYGMQIINISRSHETWERIEFKIHIAKATPESIYALRKEVFNFLSVSPRKQ